MVFHQFPDLIGNSSYCLLYNSYDVSLENSVLDLLNNPLIDIFFFLITCLLAINRVVIVRRFNSFLVTHGN